MVVGNRRPEPFRISLTWIKFRQENCGEFGSGTMSCLEMLM